MLDVDLTPQRREFAEREVAAGRYADVGEVVRAGLRKLMEERGAAFRALQADLAEQIALAEAGEIEDFDPREFEPEAFR